MNFSFSEALNSQSSTIKPLEGNNIHEVIFDGCENSDFAGVQDPNKNFKVLKIKFHNDEGSFTHTIWQPRDEDFQDRVSPQGFRQPANVLSMLYLLKHLIDAVCPDVAEKINSGEIKMDINPNNWDVFRKFIVDKTAASVGTTTKIKLIKNTKGEAIFPYFLSYNRDGKAYMTTNFIGNGIYFTTKEMEKINKANAAKPTITASDNLSLDVTAKAVDDDFNDDI